MIPRILFLLALGFSPVLAADATPEDLLRQGLFEEEANHDLDKAAERYRAVIAAHDRQRTLAAAATFRLGEIARKKNDRDAAAEAFRTVVGRFPEQAEVARLSRENLAALGIAPPTAPAAETPTAPQAADPEDMEIARLKETARNSPDLLDGAGTDGWRPMHHAAKQGWTKVISYLLDNKADPNSRTTKERLTPSQLASIHGHLGALKTLIAAKADINATFAIASCPENALPARDRRSNKAQGDWSALDLAILFDRREIARTLIAAGADLMRAGTFLNPDNQNLGVADQFFSLVNAGAEPIPFTPLLLAIELHRDELAMDLIKAGAPLTASEYKNAPTPLQIAVLRNPDFVETLLKAKADPNLGFPSFGVTPLHDASVAGLIKVAQLLIDAGAHANAADSLGHTPLHFAANAEMVDLLVSKGADPNARDKAGLTPLDTIAQGFALPDPSTIEALLKHGASVEDAKALFQRATPKMLPVVRDRVVYPKEYRPDAILLSLDNDCSPAILPGSRRQGNPYLGVMEIRPASGSPPPSIPEALWWYFAATGGDLSLNDLKIIRRDANGKFLTIFDWSSKGDEFPIKNPPALEWGDIVELQVSNSGFGSPTLSGRLFGWLESKSRTVTLRLDGISFSRRLVWEGSESWLGSADLIDQQRFMKRPRGPRPVVSQPDASVSYLSFVRELIDPSRISVTRKGVEKPIMVDLTLKDARPFRLIDGDVIDVVLLDSFRKDMEKNQQALFLTGDFKSGGRVNAGGLVRTINGYRQLTGQSLFPETSDWSGIRILRGGAGKKVERVDLAAWLRALPAREAWDYDKIEASEPKLQAGDIVVLPPLPGNAGDAMQKTSQETAEKLSGLFSFLNQTRQTRPRVVPPPQPGK